LDLESYWIDKIKTPFIGDDGALIDNYVYTMDAFWEGTHFKHLLSREVMGRGGVKGRGASGSVYMVRERERSR